MPKIHGGSGRKPRAKPLTPADKEFYSGVLVSLAVVAQFDNEVIYDHIAQSVDERALWRASRGEEYDRAHLRKYRYGPNGKRPYGG
jgi:hypothetical protein